jgi:hypothetical protein
MPVYLFSNPKNPREVKEVVMSVNDEHVYIQNGIKWDRVFTVPTASIDTEINENNSGDFVEKTKKKNYSIGDLWDKSAELSAKREKTIGRDPVKEKAANDYKKRTGKEHPHMRKKDTTFSLI